MQILMVSFEESLSINLQGEAIELVAFKTQEHGNIKFGVKAPRSVKVHREEIYHAIKEKEKETDDQVP
jgi:carbon storage regulator